jgi:hypothetical protein
LKRPRRKKKDSPIVNVVGQLAYLMLGRVFVPKYLDPGSLVVNVHINKSIIQNTLIDLGVDHKCHDKGYHAQIKPSRIIETYTYCTPTSR